VTQGRFYCHLFGRPGFKAIVFIKDDSRNVPFVTYCIPLQKMVKCAGFGLKRRGGRDSLGDPVTTICDPYRLQVR
jgi:hypothetical protein